MLQMKETIKMKSSCNQYEIVFTKNLYNPDELLTIDQILKREILYRLNVRKMTRTDTAKSLGYSIKGLRLICIRLKIPLDCNYKNINGDIIRVRITKNGIKR